MAVIKVDLLIKNAMVFNSYYKTFHKAHVSVLGNKFYYIDKQMDKTYQAGKTIDAEGLYMIPGMIDIHMHIESSMLTPEPFCERIAGCGVTTIVSEPHEIANAAGSEGVKAMIEGARDALIDVFYGIPSSVPSTNAALETTGGIIDCEAMKELHQEEQVVCVGEIMNYAQIIEPNDLEISKFLKYLEEHDPRYIVEGHCPKLVDLDLAKFLYLGIDGDHTEHDLPEIAARFENGMFVELQHKTTRPDIIAHIMENNLYEYMCFVTDDTMPDVLYEEGHLNVVIKEALSLGFPIEQAVYCSSYTPAKRMKLSDRGTIAPGKLADFVLLDDLAALSIAATYKKGKCVFDASLAEAKEKEPAYRFPSHFYHSVKIKDLKEEDFIPYVKEDVSQVRVRVMEVNEKNNANKADFRILPVKEGKICWEDSDLSLTAVFERYGKNGNVSLGFVSGVRMKRGAVATTYAHDHHNLMVQGSNVSDMLIAANRLKELQGGIAVVLDGEVLAEVRLDVGGILSDQPVSVVAKRIKAVRAAMAELGYVHYNSIMNLCTLSLPVSPELKITDVGLVDVPHARIVPLYELVN